MDKRKSTKSQAPNYKQTQMFKIQNLKESMSGHWNLRPEIYLEFGVWNFGFLTCLLSILLLIPLNIGCQRSKAGITVAGSTSVEPFAELLAEEYMSRHSESHIYVQGGGS
ncbi:MAG: hypothetical protein MUP41_17580, partial [Desulfobacterales bacterium]|nr:hypothetical protein [Desulfobacterales bacterium]